MRVALAQIQSFQNRISENVERHLQYAKLASKNEAHAVFFSELSLSSYITDEAKNYVLEINDNRLDVFQTLSDAEDLTIGIGVPTSTGLGIYISMLIFQKGEKRQSYSKQILHEDELPFFKHGQNELAVEIKYQKIAPAICYESVQEAHLIKAINMHRADIYLASVAKTQSGMTRVSKYYKEKSKAHSIPILVCNAVGPCNGFVAGGGSAVWNSNGDLVEQLSADRESILIYDTETKSAEIINLD